MLERNIEGAHVVGSSRKVEKKMETKVVERGETSGGLVVDKLCQMRKQGWGV